jgi:hypothetical protein
MMEMPRIFLELDFFLSLLSTRPAKDIENHINFQCSDPWFKIDTGHVSIYKSLRFFFLGNAYLFTTALIKWKRKKKLDPWYIIDRINCKHFPWRTQSYLLPCHQIMQAKI